MDDIKRVRKGLGGAFNDVVLASITNGFRELLRSRGESVDRVVRTLVPVSVRPRNPGAMAVGDGTLQNKVSAMFAALPVGIDDPAERLRAITLQMTGLKESKEAVAGEALTSLSGFAPPMLLALGMRLATRVAQRNVNTVTTNVPGPQLPLYVAGRRMVTAYPYVPLAGQVRIGLAIFSYDGQVTFGITGDWDTTEDLDVLGPRHRERHAHHAGAVPVILADPEALSPGSTSSRPSVPESIDESARRGATSVSPMAPETLQVRSFRAFARQAHPPAGAHPGTSFVVGAAPSVPGARDPRSSLGAAPQCRAAVHARRRQLRGDRLQLRR